MSEKNTLTSFYQNFSTETLESMLRDLTLSENELDMDQFDAIIAELDRREGAPETTPPEEALAQFRDVYSGSESGYLDCAHTETAQKEDVPIPHRAKHPRVGLRAVLIAATMVVLIFGSMIAAQAGGFDVFGSLARWTDEVFGFGNVYNRPPEATVVSDFVWPDTAVPEGTKFDSLQEALDAHGLVFEIGEPTWLPDGFEFEDSQFHFEYDASIPEAYIHASYINEYGSRIHVTFQNYITTPSTTYEKTDAPVEEFTIGNNTYYVFSNETTEKVAWTTAHFECCVFGHVTREEVLEVAKSIYH